MRAIRSLTSLVAGAALFLLASSAGAGTHSLGGKFTANRGKAAQVPVVGTDPAGFINPCVVHGDPLMFRTGGATPPMGVTTVEPPPPAAVALGVNQRGIKDLGCVPVKAGVMVVTPAVGGPVMGGAFTLPKGAFFQDGPGGLFNAISVTDPPGFVQFATSNIVSGPPTPRDESPGGTMLTGCIGMGGTKMCANQAPVGAFKAGPRILGTGSGRLAASFKWCPPFPPAMNGSACAAIGGGPPGGFKAIVKYYGTSSSFGGTMGYITRAVAQGSLFRPDFANPGQVIKDPFPPPGGKGSQPTGRGYADWNVDVLLAGVKYSTFQVALVNPNPMIGPQNLIVQLGANLGPAGGTAKAYNWGFPLTTARVIVRNTGTVAGQPHTTTLSGEGYDCVGAKGVGCAVPTGNNYRNINLVAGAVGGGIFAGVFIVPTINFASVYLPEPGATLQHLAGAIGMLGIAAWRSRRVR